MAEKAEIRVKFEIGEIKFEAEGSADLVERERSIFNNKLLPAAIDAIVRTRGVEHGTQYIDTAESQPQVLLTASDNALFDNTALNSDNDFSRTTLASFIKRYGVLTEQDFVLFSAYFNEIKNQASYFTKDEAEKSYDEARRTKPQNVSMCLNQLAQKGFIIDATDVEQKIPKPYRISSEGLNYIKTYAPKTPKEKKTSNKTRKQRVKEESVYADIKMDELNLDSYPPIESCKDFKEKMMLVLYIVTIEKKGEFFTTNDVLCLLTDKFGESATKDQVNGVFKRKTWFKTERVLANSKAVKRKLLNQGIVFAKDLIEKKLKFLENTGEINS